MTTSTVSCLIGFLLATFVTSAPLLAQSAAQADTAAVVNEQVVSLNVVHHFLDRSLANLPELAKREDRSAAVIEVGTEHCVNREVVLQHLQSGKYKTSTQEIDRQIEELEAQLKRIGTTLEQHLDKLQLTRPELGRERLWTTTWRKYAANYVTVDHLQQQFELKRRYFDGTKMHVAQILLKDNSPETMAKAKTIGEQLNSKQLAWSDAVKEFSESASAANDGDLGWIEYSGPMPRTFTQRAFELASGDYSKPFSSNYGVHIVRCIEVVDGTRTFEDVVQELRELETNRLFEIVATQNRQGARVNISPLDSSQEK